MTESAYKNSNDTVDVTIRIKEAIASRDQEIQVLGIGWIAASNLVRWQEIETIEQ